MTRYTHNFQLFVFLFLNFLVISIADRSFTIDYKNNYFLKDGQPFRYVSGSIHYFRVRPELWEDRLHKMKMAGLNAIQTYVEWNHHEPEPGVYNFEDSYDLPKFLQTAQSVGLLVILRTGPFIDAERDMGGLPYWLMRIDPNMKLRTYDANYIKYVERWYSVLLPLIRPLLYKNGGPIIMTQIENEYGGFGCDAQYTSYLRDLFLKYLENDVVLFTTDGSASSLVTCGKVDQVLATIDFGTGANVTDLFNMLRWHQSFGPLVNSEFYPGWLDHWGAPHANVSSESVSTTLFNILSANASVNIYMFHGGTSFGFSAGSNLGSTFQACPTSYDYDAPLSEAGDPTPKYYAIRETIGKFLPLPPGPVPQPAPKLSLGPVHLKPGISVFEFARNTDPVASQYPLPFEDLKQAFGFVLYETNIMNMTTDPVLLTVPNLADRGYVYVNMNPQGILSREQKIFSIPIKAQRGDTVQVFVENQGRVCYGSGINDRKGIFSNVTLGSAVLRNWKMTTFPMDGDTIRAIPAYSSAKQRVALNVPHFYTGNFTIDQALLDTFLRLDGFHKGVAFINGFNLGRYWPIVGPQITLYVPGVLLKKAPEVNIITVLELEHAPCDDPDLCVVTFEPDPVVNGTTPTTYQSGTRSWLDSRGIHKI